MKTLLVALALLLCGCGDEGSTSVTVVGGEDNQATVGDPVTQSECAGSDDQCAQQVD